MELFTGDRRRLYMLHQSPAHRKQQFCKHIHEEVLPRATFVTMPPRSCGELFERLQATILKDHPITDQEPNNNYRGDVLHAYYRGDVLYAYYGCWSFRGRLPTD